MATDDVREAAKSVIRRQVWEADRGKATRAFLRGHPEVSEEFTKTGTITKIGLVECTACKGHGCTEAEETLCGICNGTGKVQMKEYPEHVTRASVLLELNTRARRHESAAAAKQWAKDHPEEVQKMRDEIRKEQGAAE